MQTGVSESLSTQCFLIIGPREAQAAMFFTVMTLGARVAVFSFVCLFVFGGGIKKIILQDKTKTETLMNPTTD